MSCSCLVTGARWSDTFRNRAKLKDGIDTEVYPGMQMLLLCYVESGCFFSFLHNFAQILMVCNSDGVRAQCCIIYIFVQLCCRAESDVGQSLILYNL